MNQKKNPFGFVRTTAIGGLLFLLPLIVVGALIGQVVPIVITVAHFLREILPGTFRTPGGLAILILLAIAVVLLLCFAAGVIARNSIGRKFSEAFEKNGGGGASLLKKNVSLVGFKARTQIHAACTLKFLF